MSSLVKYDNKGKVIIDTKAAFIESINGVVPKGEWNYKEHLDYIQSLVIEADPNVTSGALSNCRGTWFEWMIAIDTYNDWCLKKHQMLLLPLPNIKQFDCATLYNEKINKYIFDLRQKLKASLDIELITSNPDFVILDTSALSFGFERNPIECIDVNALLHIDSLFRDFVGKCGFNDIVGYMATKTSLRPDRRLQIVHEGSLAKALYVHLQTRLWIDKPRALRYFGASLQLNEKDKRALKTVATHSITTVLSEPVKAVDECFELTDRVKLLESIQKMKRFFFHELNCLDKNNG